MVCTLHVLRRLVSPRQKISRSCFFFTIFCSTSWDLSIWSKKIKILSKKIFTEYKDDYVTFWEICETKILLPSIFFNFFPLKYHWNKKMLLASICKRYIFFLHKGLHQPFSSRLWKGQIYPGTQIFIQFLHFSDLQQYTNPL